MVHIVPGKLVGLKVCLLLCISKNVQSFIIFLPFYDIRISLQCCLKGIVKTVQILLEYSMRCICVTDINFIHKNLLIESHKSKLVILC